MRSFFRYPGGKYKLREIILKELYKFDLPYIEPFCGGASIAISYAIENKGKKIWLNDHDFALTCLWKAVIDNHQEFKRLISNFTPSVDHFFEFKDDLAKLPIELTKTEIGFRKLAVHQMSFSGLGTMAGGPIGGETQKKKNGEPSNYLIGCRWSTDYLCKKVDYLHNILSSAIVTSWDFREVIERSKGQMLYCDPPYFNQGDALYEKKMKPEDHYELCDYLRHHKAFVLSYDDCKEIREMYRWANIREVCTNYSINSIKGNSKTELLICPM